MCFWRTCNTLGHIVAESTFWTKKNVCIIQVCMLLHSFIVDSRQGVDTEDARVFREFNICMDRFQWALTRQTGAMPLIVVEH